MAAFTLRINGQEQQVEVDPDTPLLWVIRDSLGLTGTKYSCGEGVCGACTVHLNGAAAHSCVTPVSAAASKEITTIEGLSTDGSHPVQQAWIAESVSECGYCQPGQIMAAAALLIENSNPSDAEIEAALGNSLCRCGTYGRIRKAIKRAAGGKK